jgi:hypothetical protein
MIESKDSDRRSIGQCLIMLAVMDLISLLEWGVLLGSGRS